MEAQNEEIQEKQNYLINEIVNENYSPEKFSDYISNFKENGTDLNNWTLDELKQIVISFKNQEKSREINYEETIEKEVENVRNSFILSKPNKENNLNNKDEKFLNNLNLSNKNNPYDNIFNEKEDEKLKNQENISSNLNKQEDIKKVNSVSSEMGDFEIIEPSEFIDSSTDKLMCIKQEENSLTKYNDLTVIIKG